jgi:superfamily II DNA or RNA helicase
MFTEPNKTVGMNINNIATGFTSNWIRTDVDVMQPKEIGFVHPPRKWQSECFQYLGHANPVSIINAPMGSGKSTELCMIAYDRLLKNNKLKALIACPENLIGKGFGEKVFSLPNGEIVDWSAEKNLILDKRQTTEQVSEFIKEDLFYSKYYTNSRICICTNQTLVKAFNSLSDDEKSLHWNNLVILFDEAHHIKMDKKGNEVYEMNELAQVLDYSYYNNNEIVLMTASLFRGDKKGILSDKILNNSLKFNLSFYEYWAEMKYLECLKYDFVVGVNNYTEDIKDAFSILSEHNLNKQIIFIPMPKARMSTGDGKYQEIQDIIEQKRIELNGITKFDDVTGIYHICNNNGLDYKIADLVTEFHRNKVEKYIEQSDINKNRNAIDCIIAMNKANEGFDWIHADGMVIVGVRHSTTRLFQMIGRLLRDVPNKPIIKVVHMLDFAPHLPASPNLENNLNDCLKFLYATFLLLDVIAPSQVQTNDLSAPTGQLTNTVRQPSSNIFDDLEIDLNQRNDLVEKSYKKLASKFLEGHRDGFKELLPEIVQSWLVDNNVDASKEEIEKLADKVWKIIPSSSQTGIDLSDVDVKLLEAVGPLGFLMRFAGFDITKESLKESLSQFSSSLNQGESESNRKTRIVCKRVNEKGYPNVDFVDESGLNHYSFIHGRKQAKQGFSESAWYDSDQNIAVNEYNLIGLFDLVDNKPYFLKLTENLIIFHKKNGKYPTASDDKELSGFLSRQRSKDKKCKYFQECLDYAIFQGYPNIFDPIDAIKQMIDKIEKLFSYVNKNGEPTSKDKDKTNFYLIGTLRSCRQGKSENVWYSEFDVLFEENNMWHLIETAKEFSLRQTIKLKNLCLDKKRAPLSSIENEKELCAFVQRKVSGKTKWYPEEIDLLEKNSVFKYFLSNTQKRINTWILNIEELSKYIKENDGKFPSKKTHSKELATLQECKRRFANNDLEQIILDKFDELEMASHLKFVDKEFESKQKFIKLCDRLQKGTRPSAKSEIEGDFSLSSYMSTLLKGLRGQRGFINYSFYSEIAKEKNVQHFFEGLI